MTYFLGIDPGNVESAWALIRGDNCKPVDFGKADNKYVRDLLIATPADTSVGIEMVASYGMAIGRDVIWTIAHLGRFWQIREDAELIERADVKLHHCHTRKANDANITAALVDRFAFGLPNKGKGTDAAPGHFYKFKRDVWQAYALAVLMADRAAGRE